jgi:hypothetical protein
VTLETLGFVDGHGLSHQRKRMRKVRRNWTQILKISEREFVKPTES